MCRRRDHGFNALLDGRGSRHPSHNTGQRESEPDRGQRAHSSYRGRSDSGQVTGCTLVSGEGRTESIRLAFLVVVERQLCGESNGGIGRGNSESTCVSHVTAMGGNASPAEMRADVVERQLPVCDDRRLRPSWVNPRLPDRSRLSGGEAPLAVPLASTDRWTLGSRSSPGRADRRQLCHRSHRVSRALRPRCSRHR
jgi:hypothetical protein